MSIPQWMIDQLEHLRLLYPNDRFEIVARRAQGPNADREEWRIKCQDCPGKLYIPGPEETLGNFEIHLQNRQHKQRVTSRS
ncbi:hypothetical protein SISNIDRAFT_450717 [Sistotremastrum niveocremeum HHB9708]|uniref:Uncharacterized protein n=2 Tax=Sistotremastraceae TaxID=3402574 RepID=A0A164YI98_9AGAM|nr:hypothetical protein SISNIDRAFT_450717 [Sistotremastrum niveocremeum HHB9708]KZT43361.1 hypothetical protein SISSUDRAFT_1040363 [Sistotremastrum suecicum HHB10207 ss-3]